MTLITPGLYRRFFPLIIIGLGVAVYTTSSLLDLINIKNLLQINSAFSSSNLLQPTGLIRSFALLFAGSSLFRLLGTIITEYGCALFGISLANQKFISIFSLVSIKNFRWSQSEISSLFSTEVHALINGLLLPTSLFFVSALNIIIVVIGSAVITDPSFLIAPTIVFLIYIVFFWANTNKSRYLRLNIKDQRIRVHRYIKEMYLGRAEYLQSLRHRSQVQSYTTSIKRLSFYDIQVKLLGIYPKHFLEIIVSLALLAASAGSLFDDLHTSTISIVLVYGFLVQRLVPLAQNCFSQISAIRCYSYLLDLFDLNFKSKASNVFHHDPLAIHHGPQDHAYVDQFSFTLSPPKPNNPSQSHLILSKPITFESGNVYCVSGPSGIGKSFLFNSLVGFVDSSSFDLSIHYTVNESSFNLPVQSLQSQNKLSYLYIPQNSFLADDSIWKNVTLFSDNNSSSLSVEEVISILNLGSNGVLDSRPDLDLYESCNINDEKLSGGQMQRIVLAKSLFSSRNILILDEPTSQLDTSSELAFMHFVKDWISFKKVVILISHSQQIQKLSDYNLNLANFLQ